MSSFTPNISIQRAPKRLPKWACLLTLPLAAAISAQSYAACKYEVNSEWNNGFVATITVTNSTSTPINNWQVNWQYAGADRMTNGWSANYSGSNPYSATNMSWNGSLQPNQSVQIGFQGNKGASAAEIPTITGAVCQPATQPSSSSSSIRSSAPSSIATSSSVPSSVISSSSAPSSIATSSSIASVISSSAPSSVATSSSSSVRTSSSAPSSVATSSATYTSSSAPSSLATSSSSSTSSLPNIEQGAIDIIDDSKYDGNISLDETKVVGTPGAPLQTTGNPFANSYFYLSPDIKIMMDTSIDYVEGDNNLGNARKANLLDKIKFVQRQPSAIWMDSIATIDGDPAAGRRSLKQHLDSAVAQQNYYAQVDGQKSPMTVVIIIYNLPDRDCAAFASNGQLYEIGKPWQWTGQLGGMQTYKEQYIDKITSIIKSNPNYGDLRIVTMLEPDSYPNMITNTMLNPDGPSLIWPALTTTGTANGTTYCDTLLTYSSPGLEAGLGVYGRGLQIAIDELYEAGQTFSSNNIYTYLDIGHAGWLGWDDAANQNSNLKRGVDGFIKLIRGANKSGISGFRKVRGFATNTSGYTPTEEPAISNLEGDRQVLQSFFEWNKSVDEMSYIDNFNAAILSKVASVDSTFKPGFIIDTARNGWGQDNRPTLSTATRGTDVSKRIDLRPHRGHWCNPDKAGVGEVPKPSPVANRPHLDTFFWMKPPGESDGISFKATEYTIGSANYQSLDAIDKAIVNDALDPKYAGKELDTMCEAGNARDGGTLTVTVPAMAPHAGGWFHKQFIMLIDNAHPALGTTEYPN